MSLQRATRLAETASGPPGGTRGWRGRRAWRLRLAAGDAGDGHAIEAVRQQWLREPHPEAYAALCRRRPDLSRDICTEVLSASTSLSTRTRLAALCAEHGLAPDDPA